MHIGGGREAKGVLEHSEKGGEAPLKFLFDDQYFLIEQSNILIEQSSIPIKLNGYLCSTFQLGFICFKI